MPHFLTVRRFFSRLLARLGYQVRQFLVCRLAKRDTVSVSATGATVRKLVVADADEIVAFRTGPDASLFQERLHSGQQCFAAILDTRIASVSWVASHRATIWALDADFRLNANTAYIFDSYTHPDFRGMRLQAAIFEDVLQACASAGIDEIVTFVEPTNIANIRSRARLGFHEAGKVRRFQLGRRSWYFSAGSAPQLEGRGSRRQETP